MSDHETSYGECVGMFELSRIKPRQHVIESIAAKVLEAARLGAQILDESDEALYRRVKKFAPQMCGHRYDYVEVWTKETDETTVE